MRALLFTVWVYAGKTASETIDTLEALAVAQYETVTHGGARMVRASLSGKSFDYEMPANWGPTDFIESVRLCYKVVLTRGADGRMTDAELQDYILDTSEEQVDTMTARVSNYRYGR
jgi:hypothetical protein